MIHNIILDACGIVILLLLLIPHFSDSPGRRFNRRKQDLLLYAALLHFFTLCVRIAGAVSALAMPGSAAAKIFSVTTVVPAICSAVLLVLCIFCDESGAIRLPKGRPVPVGQITCAVLPPVIAFCLGLLFPSFSFWGIAWSVALQLIQSFILADSERKLTESEQRLDRSQAALMTVQMQPHFIFNTLSAIQALCRTDANAAAENTENLSGYLRANIDGLTGEALIPFDEELRHIRQYVALEQADPARRFHFDYELDAREFVLPPLTVQPIVENAVKHGALTHRDGTGRVLLTTESVGNYIRITVTDNGTDNSGLTEAQQEKRGVGIAGTRKRLEALCGGSLQITASESGTKAVILIPKKGD